MTVRLNLAGANELIAQLKQMGSEGEAALKQLSAAASASEGSLGVMGRAVDSLSEGLKSAVGQFQSFVIGAGVIVGAVGAVAGGLFELSKKSSESTVAVERLGDQAGVTVTQMSGMLGALTNMGAKTEDLSTVFKRLAVAISTVWPEIQKSVKDAANLIIDDQNRIRASSLAVEGAQLSLFNARQRLANLTGTATDPQVAKAMELKAAQLAVADAEQRLAEAVQKRAEAAKKASDDQKNDLTNVAAVVKLVTDGVIDFQSASTKANLNLDNVIKGLVINAGPAVEALGQFKGSLADLGNAAPNVQAVFFKLADFMKNSGDASLNTAVAFKLFGRGVQQDLIEAMSKGSDAIKGEISRLKDLGLVLDEFDKDAAKGLEKASNRLSSVTGVLTAQIGNRFAPAFTEGMNLLTKSIEDSHGTILAWANDLAQRVAPVTRDFFRAISGGTKFETPWVATIVEGSKQVIFWLRDTLGPVVLDIFRVLGGEKIQTPWVQNLVDGLRKAKDAVVDIAGALRETFGFIGDALKFIGDTINNTFGTNLTGADVAIAAFAIAAIAALSPVAGALAAILILIEKISASKNSGLTKEGSGLLDEQEAFLNTLKQAGKITDDQFADMQQQLGEARDTLKSASKDGDLLGLKEFNSNLKSDLKGLKDEFPDVAASFAESFRKANADIKTDTDRTFDELAAKAKASLGGAAAGAGGEKAAADLNKAGDAARANATVFALVDGKLQLIGTTVKTVGADGSVAFEKLGQAIKNVGSQADKTKDAVKEVPPPKVVSASDTIFKPKDDKSQIAPTALTQAFTDAAAKINEVIASIIESVTAMTTDIGDEISGLTEVLVEPFKSAADQIVQILDPIAQKVQEILNNISQINFGGLGFGGNPEGAPFATGTNAPLQGPGTSTSDSIPAWLSRGEAVLQSRSVSALVKRFGFGIVGMLNNFHKMPGFALGGMLDGLSTSFSSLAMPRFPASGLVPAPTSSGGALRGATFVLDGRRFPMQGPDNIVRDFENAATVKGYLAGRRKPGWYHRG